MNVDFKSHIGPHSFFRQSLKNELSKNVVTGFQNKETQMDMNKDSEKNSMQENILKNLLKTKSNYQIEEEKTKQVENENHTFQYLKRLMNVI
jgi:protoporphyrinogen oxidase